MIKLCFEEGGIHCIDSLSMKLKEVELKIIPVYQNIYFGNEIKVLNFYSDLHLLYQELVDNQFDISALFTTHSSLGQ